MKNARKAELLRDVMYCLGDAMETSVCVTALRKPKTDPHLEIETVEGDETMCLRLEEKE